MSRASCSFPFRCQVPGDAFGEADHVRIGFALTIDRITEAMERLETFVQSLSNP